MSQRDNFSGGFLLGTLVGGIVGGALGALWASGLLNEVVSSEPSEEPLLNASQPDAKEAKPRKRSLKSTNGHGEMEIARRSLEDKIAQLNDAIDDVRQQLGGVNQVPGKEEERSMTREP